MRWLLELIDIPDVSYTVFHHKIGRDDHQLSMMIKDKEHFVKIANQIRLDHGMHAVAVEQEQRIIKKNRQINDLKCSLFESFPNQEFKKLENAIYNQNLQMLELKLINRKIIEAKQKLTQKLADTIEKNVGLEYLNNNLQWNKDMGVKLIELLREKLLEKIIHIHKPEVIHMHEKDLDNLKEYRDLYKRIGKILGQKYVEASRANQYATAGIYAELMEQL